MIVEVTTKPCMGCGDTKVLRLEAEDIRKWQNRTFIQDAFPYLNADDRERLQSGTCPPCWDKMMGEEE